MVGSLSAGSSVLEKQWGETRGPAASPQTPAWHRHPSGKPTSAWLPAASELVPFHPGQQKHNGLPGRTMWGLTLKSPQELCVGSLEFLPGTGHPQASFS